MNSRANVTWFGNDCLAGFRAGVVIFGDTIITTNIVQVAVAVHTVAVGIAAGFTLETVADDLGIFGSINWDSDTLVKDVAFSFVEAFVAILLSVLDDAAFELINHAWVKALRLELRARRFAANTTSTEHNDLLAFELFVKVPVILELTEVAHRWADRADKAADLPFVIIAHIEENHVFASNEPLVKLVTVDVFAAGAEVGVVGVIGRDDFLAIADTQVWKWWHVTSRFFPVDAFEGVVIVHIRFVHVDGLFGTADGAVQTIVVHQDAPIETKGFAHFAVDLDFFLHVRNIANFVVEEDVIHMKRLIPKCVRIMRKNYQFVNIRSKKLANYS